MLDDYFQLLANNGNGETVKDTNTSALDRQHDPTGTCGDQLNPLDFSVTNVPVKKPDSTKIWMTSDAASRPGAPAVQAERSPVAEGAFRRPTVIPAERERPGPNARSVARDPHSVWRNDPRSR